jgi:hypothetical protein
MHNSVAAHSKFRSGPIGPAYNEAAFRHFLAVERSRALRSRRFLYLVLVAVRERVGRRARLTDPIAAALFQGLGASVREVDFVGWFREGQVAAAILSQGATAAHDAASVIASRVRTAVVKELAPIRSTELRVRVVRLGGSERV